ncbi:jg20383 [Pararge aegeria aegeria]|uniref:Jg20383 protein n=1 Tax=Pararge aegeria aegeria TaxID=348720 RepID=A0A8S4QWV0_9NEOP|nr:jg20383 [Pararge aegeria aegeria]
MKTQYASALVSQRPPTRPRSSHHSPVHEKTIKDLLGECCLTPEASTYYRHYVLTDRLNTHTAFTASSPAKTRASISDVIRTWTLTMVTGEFGLNHHWSKSTPSPINVEPSLGSSRRRRQPRVIPHFPPRCRRALGLFSWRASNLALYTQKVCQYTRGSITPQTWDTIVIGLGSAGTTAASTLASAGRRVLALEAQDRIGGRVWTVPFGDGIVEVGGEWIHGTENSSVYEIAMKNNITVLLQEPNFKIYKSDGSEMSVDLMRELVEYGLEQQEYPPEKPEAMGDFISRK